MKKKYQIIYDLFGQIISKKVQDAHWCYGSVVELNFGMNTVIKSPLIKRETYCVEWEWCFWVYMTFWDLEINGKIVTHDDDQQKKIDCTIKKLEGKKLLNMKVLSDEYDMMLTFENDITLHLIANNTEEDNEQWRLFTPGGRILKAGPFKKLVYKSLDEPDDD